MNRKEVLEILKQDMVSERLKSLPHLTRNPTLFASHNISPDDNDLSLLVASESSILKLKRRLKPSNTEHFVWTQKKNIQGLATLGQR